MLSAQSGGGESHVEPRTVADLAPIIAELQASGVTSLRGIAKGAQPTRHPHRGRVQSLAPYASRAVVGATGGVNP
jgi:hypothetical protein